MRLENLLALTNGIVINDPFVKQFSNVIFDINKVKHGDLFIALDESNIEKAIFNGAYGVLFDKPTQIIDSEIAWIKVDNIETALKRLVRFHLIEKEVIAYSCNEIILKLALQTMTETNFVTLHGDIISISKEIWDIENSATVLFCPTLTSSELFTNIKSLPTFSSNTIHIMEQTLFETSFIYNNLFYERQLISPFFIPYLEQLLHLYTALNLNFKLKKFTPIDHFEAVFTNKKFEIKEFGTSDKVLIFEQDCSLIQKEILYLQKQASWAKTIFIIPSVNTKNLTGIPNIYFYKNENDIFNILKGNHFHFALIVGADKSILSKPLTNQKQISLFDFD